MTDDRDEFERPPAAEYVAHHEAGHAVATIEIGVRIVRVTIVSQRLNGEQVCGFVETAPTVRELVEEDPLRAPDVAMVYLAGPESSDCRLRGQAPGEYFGGGSSDDSFRAWRLDEQGFEANQARARALVVRRAKAIDRIAAALVEHLELDGPTIEALASDE